MDVDDKELEEIRKKKLLELQRRLQEAQLEQKIEEAKAAQEEAIRRSILSRILTPEAKDRLARVKLVRPEIAKLVEDYLISLYQAGRIGGKVTDEVLKKLLAQLHERLKRDFRIKR